MHAFCWPSAIHSFTVQHCHPIIACLANPDTPVCCTIKVCSVVAVGPKGSHLHSGVAGVRPVVSPWFAMLHAYIHYHISVLKLHCMHCWQ